MSPIEFYRDESGAPRARPATPDQQEEAMLAQFLESDLQDDDQTCRELLDALSRLEEQGTGHYEFIGNSYALDLDPERIVMACHGDEEGRPVTIDPAELRRVVQDWLGFIEN